MIFRAIFLNEISTNHKVQVLEDKMASLPEYSASELHILELLFLLKFDEHIKELDQSDKKMDEDAYRQALSSRFSPEFAKRFEQLTGENRQQTHEVLAIAKAVAYTVTYALDNR